MINLIMNINANIYSVFGFLLIKLNLNRGFFVFVKFSMKEMMMELKTLYIKNII